MLSTPQSPVRYPTHHEPAPTVLMAPVSSMHSMPNPTSFSGVWVGGEDLDEIIMAAPRGIEGKRKTLLQFVRSRVRPPCGCPPTDCSGPLDGVDVKLTASRGKPCCDGSRVALFVPEPEGLVNRG